MAAALLSLAACAPLASGVAFNEDVRPILSDRCFFCHGPDAAERKADLRLDLRESAVGSGVLVPGDPVASELLARVAHADPDERMPPPEAKIGRLSEGEIETLRQWIAEGAEYEEHWAFRPVGDGVEVPDAPATHAALVRNPIDAFVFAGLAERGLEPQPEADRETLVRRLSFDLTGLPPTLEEIDAFLADGGAGAYGRLVDRLLASPRFGERMATDWLDLARYADTYGFQVDRDRDVWPWRDWVVRAFNENLPYDRFATWQLAGDLLEDPTDDQVLATAFNRLHQQKVEGGSVEEEFRVEYVADRVHTFGTAFLGLTLECARCHDHKYDPVTTADYYRLFAFFQNIDEAGLYSYFTDSVPTPTLALATGEEKARLAALEAAVADEEAAAPASPDPGGPALARFTFEGDGTVNAVDPSKPLKIEGSNKLAPGRAGGGSAVVLTGDDPVALPAGNFPRWQPFSVALWMRVPAHLERAVVFHRSKAWTDAGSRGYELLIENGRPKWSLIHFWPGNAASVIADEPLPVGEWVHLTVTSDGSSRAAGLKIYTGGNPVHTRVVRDALTKQITGGGGPNITIGERMRDRGFTGGLVDDFQVFSRELLPAEVPSVAAGEELDGSPGPAYAQHLERLRGARERRDNFLDGLREIMVMRELPEPKPAYVLRRGAYDARGEEVRMDVPGFLTPLPEGALRNRLGLARWLTSPDHPLFARVAANRLWATAFGRGLVTTPEDFGSQGEPPAHQGLLDWLSLSFRQNGWDQKALLRTIVASHTYRQRSTAPPTLLAEDPGNRLLARGPAFRLSAEMVRDNVLAVSGLLVENRGGPPARPYELAHSFKPSEVDGGDGRFRRSLYTYWKRTAPAPVMRAFDAARREVCSARRERTDTALQALILLNGDQFVEAARTMGNDLWAAHGDDVPALSTAAFRALTSRRPDDAELAVMADLFAGQREAAGGDGARAAGELVLALMNFDGCLVRR